MLSTPCAFMCETAIKTDIITSLLVCEFKINENVLCKNCLGLYRNKTLNCILDFFSFCRE